MNTDKQKNDIAAHIIELEKTALEQWNNGNPSGFLQQSEQEVTYFDPFFEQRLTGYAELSAYYESIRGKVYANRYAMINPAVQINGNTAVLTYNLNSYTGNEVYKWNCSEVYVYNESGEWKIIHTHWSFVKP